MIRAWQEKAIAYSGYATDPLWALPHTFPMIRKDQRYKTMQAWCDEVRDAVRTFFNNCTTWPAGKPKLWALLPIGVDGQDASATAGERLIDDPEDQFPQWYGYLDNYSRTYPSVVLGTNFDSGLFEDPDPFADPARASPAVFDTVVSDGPKYIEVNDLSGNFSRSTGDPTDYIEVQIPQKQTSGSAASMAVTVNVGAASCTKTQTTTGGGVFTNLVFTFRPDEFTGGAPTTANFNTELSDASVFSLRVEVDGSAVTVEAYTPRVTIETASIRDNVGGLYHEQGRANCANHLTRGAMLATTLDAATSWPAGVSRRPAMLFTDIEAVRDLATLWRPFSKPAGLGGNNAGLMAAILDDPRFTTFDLDGDGNSAELILAAIRQTYCTQHGLTLEQSEWNASIGERHPEQHASLIFGQLWAVAVTATLTMGANALREGLGVTSTECPYVNWLGMVLPTSPDNPVPTGPNGHVGASAYPAKASIFQDFGGYAQSFYPGINGEVTGWGYPQYGNMAPTTQYWMEEYPDVTEGADESETRFRLMVAHIPVLYSALLADQPGTRYMPSFDQVSYSTGDATYAGRIRQCQADAMHAANLVGVKDLWAFDQGYDEDSAVRARWLDMNTRYASALMADAPENPVPLGGYVPVTSARLSWAAASGATGYDVYTGPSAGALTLVSSNQAGTSYISPASPGVVLYWRVDSRNAAGVTTGTVWSFTSSSDYTVRA